MRPAQPAWPERGHGHPAGLRRPGLRVLGSVLGLALISDEPTQGAGRFVGLGGGGEGPELLLVAAATGQERRLVGRQTADRVGSFLRTTDFVSQHRRMMDAGVAFSEHPRQEPYGTVAVFSDLYANAGT